MAINLLPRDYQNELNAERARRFVIAAGFTVFLIAAVNIILLSPLWFLFEVQEKELARELEALKQSQSFLDLVSIEAEIEKLNASVRAFSVQEKGLFELASLIKSILDFRPAGISVSGISYESSDQGKAQPPRISVSGLAGSREQFLAFLNAGETNILFKKVRSPISNLLKEADFDYSLVFDLNK